MMHEASCHAANSFVTLTYNDEHVPLDWSLDVREWQLFAKRLRKSAGAFRFYQAGEYGEFSARPHYHACLFGIDFRGDRKAYKRSDSGDQLFTSEVLEQAWRCMDCQKPKGFAVIGDLTFESAAYVAGYVTKKITGDQAEEHYLDSFTGTLRKPEFATMSRRPGIGAKWIEKWADQVYPRDEVIVNGKIQKPPKFYDDRQEEEAMDCVKAKRRKYALKRKQTPERMECIGRVKERNGKIFSREPA